MPRNNRRGRWADVIAALQRGKVGDSVPVPIKPGTSQQTIAEQQNLRSAARYYNIKIHLFTRDGQMFAMHYGPVKEEVEGGLGSACPATAMC